MRRGRRFFCLTGAVFLLMAIVIAVHFFLPRLVNIGSIRSAVQSEISEKLGAQIAYGRADLFFFPRPVVILHGGTVIFRDRLRGSFDSLAAHLKILPLLRGSMGVSSLRITAPKVSVRLEKRLGENKIPTIEEMRENLRRLFKALAEKTPGLTIVMENGNLTLLEGDQTLFSFTDIDADIVFPPAGPRIKISGSSNFAKAMTVLWKLDPESLSGRAEIDIRQARLQPLFRYFMPNGTVVVEGSGIDLNLILRTSDMKTIEGEVSSPLSSLTLKRKGKELMIHGNKLKGDFRISDDRIETSLRKLHLSDPRLVLEGTLLVDRSGGQTGLNIEGHEIDVSSTRKAAYSLADDIPIVHNIFNYVRDGVISSISVTSQARSAEELGNTENIRIKGRIEKGEVFVEGPRLDFRDVSGRCVIINGMLDGTGISAGIDNARLQDGRLRVGLKGAVVPLNLDAYVATDLTTLQSLLERLLRNEAVVHEISLVKGIKGRTRGRLIMTGDSASPTVTADVQEIELFADYVRIPYPVRIIQGQVFYDGRRVATKRLNGTIGNSSFDGLTASLELEKRFFLDISSGRLSISLPEVHRWAGSYETLKPVLGRISSVEGTASLPSVDVKGPLLSPEEWRFRIRGSGRDIALNSPDLPGGVNVTGANIEATEGKLIVSGMEVRMLDSSVSLSGELVGYLKDSQRVDLTLEGFVGPESFRWISRTMTFPPWMRRSLGLSVKSSHLVWERSGATAFSGTMNVTKGSWISLDIVKGKEGLRINRLLIEDSSSKATLSLTLDEHKLGLGFSGKLTGETAESVVDIGGYGWISGDFRGEVTMGRPVTFTGTGKVTADGFVIPWEEIEPVEISRLSAEADGGRFRLDSCDLRWGDDRASLRGKLISSEEGVIIDLDASAAVIDVGSIEEKLKKVNVQGKKKEQGVISSPPAKGTIRLRADQLKYGKISLEPIRAEISLDGQGTTVNVTETRFCSISLPGRVNISRGEISLDFRLIAKDESVESTISCLSRSFDMKEYATGTFNLSGKITGRGKGEDIIRSISGDIDFTARNGRIYYEPSILKILTFLEVSEILKGYGDIRKKGLAYNKIVMKSALRHDRIEIEEGFLDSSRMKMVLQGYIDPERNRLDIKVLVSPMRTVDRVIEKVPVIGLITGNTLLSIPVRVTGDVKDPQVKPFALSSADSGLLGIMKKTISLPFRVFTPGKRDEAKEEQVNERQSAE